MNPCVIGDVRFVAHGLNLLPWVFQGLFRLSEGPWVWRECQGIGFLGIVDFVDGGEIRPSWIHGGRLGISIGLLRRVV